MKNWLTNNLALKIIALGLAIVTWIYVNGELKNYPHDQTSSHQP